MSLDLALMLPPGYGFDGGQPQITDLEWQADGGNLRVGAATNIAYNADAGTVQTALDTEYPAASPWNIVDNGSSGNTKRWRATGGANVAATIQLTNVDLYTSAAGTVTLTVTTQGVDGVTGVQEVVEIAASGADDITEDNHTNQVSLDGSGNYLGHNAGTGWTAGTPGNPMSFTRDATGDVSTFKTSGNGTVTVTQEGVDEVTAVAEVTSIYTNANAGTFRVDGSNTIATDESSSSLNTKVAAATGRTFNDLGAGTIGNPWELTDTTTGARADLSVTTNDTEIHTGSGGSISVTEVQRGG